MKKIITLSTLFFFSISCLNLRAQDHEFSQFYATPIYTNPASTGSDFSRAALAYRVQNYGFQITMATFNAAYDEYVKKIHGGIGLMYTNRDHGGGLLTENNVGVSYAFEESINNDLSIRLGLQCEVIQKTLIWDRKRWGNDGLRQVGIEVPFYYNNIDKTITGLNFSIGSLIYTERFYLGLVCHNLFEPEHSFFDSQTNAIQTRKYLLHTGIVMPYDDDPDDLAITPNVLIQYQSKSLAKTMGFYANKGPVVIGLWLRQTFEHADILIGMIGFRIKQVRVGFTMEYNTTRYYNFKKTFDITASYGFKRRVNQNIEPRLRCPLF